MANGNYRRFIDMRFRFTGRSIDMRFRFTGRSKGRDKQSDSERIDRVLSTLVSARTEVEREECGLRRRVNEWYAAAAGLMDTSGEFNQRSLNDEADINRFSAQASAGQRRLVDLEEQVAFFEDLILQVKDRRSLL